MKDLEGKVAFVTGGASGMGLAMVRSFLRAGMKVVAADVEEDALARVRAEFAGHNGFLALRVDVTDRDAMARAADETERAFGKVHVVCNNAGVAVAGRIDSMTYRDWDWVLGVNLNGVVNGLQTFIERIVRHGEGGHIVNTASMAGQMPVPGLSVYNASKYAVVGISETIRQELAPMGIGVSVLCPGVVATNIFDSGRNRPAEMKPEDGKDNARLVVGSDGGGASAASDAGQEAQRAAMLAAALDPATVGDMVVDAIRNDDAYIFTHPELKGIVDMRQAAIAAGFERWAAYKA
jgi:NADP-dependent 3-hydroxy acid dehydrogenase YdfG